MTRKELEAMAEKYAEDPSKSLLSVFAMVEKAYIVGFFAARDASAEIVESRTRTADNSDRRKLWLLRDKIKALGEEEK